MSRQSLATVFHGSNVPIELRSVDVPDPVGREILVEVSACTLCGSDLHTLHGRRSTPVPTVLGHEILGRIVAFGHDAPRVDASGAPLSVGDRVTWAVVASCGACFFCLRNLPQKCEHQTKYGHEAIRPDQILSGGLARHCVLVGGTAVYRVPEGLSDAAACPANCATATVAAALEAAGSLAGATVLVVGCGMLGLTAAAWAADLGARVIATDVDPARLARSIPFGAALTAEPATLVAAVREATDGRGVDAVLELSGAPEAIASAIPLLRVGGTLVLVGTVFPTEPVAILPEQVVRRCLTIRGVHNYRPDHLAAALAFLERQYALPWDSLVGPWQPLERLAQAIHDPDLLSRPRIGIRP
ncbi:MAG: zinc-binding dehydrogenase [Isosphaeraceae bacterium]